MLRTVCLFLVDWIETTHIITTSGALIFSTLISLLMNQSFALREEKWSKVPLDDHVKHSPSYNDKFHVCWGIQACIERRYIMLLKTIHVFESEDIVLVTTFQLPMIFSFSIQETSNVPLHDFYTWKFYVQILRLHFRSGPRMWLSWKMRPRKSNGRISCSSKHEPK